jgi:hypothetical protein
LNHSLHTREGWKRSIVTLLIAFEHGGRVWNRRNGIFVKSVSILESTNWSNP